MNVAEEGLLLYTPSALQLDPYFPAFIAIVLSLGFCGLFVLMAVFIGPRRTSIEKEIPFECGSDPIGSPRGKYSIKFYHVAILFLVFDIESAFMYPWAVSYRTMAQSGAGVLMFAEMLIFVVVLVVALAYVWKKKAIGWD